MPGAVCRASWHCCGISRIWPLAFPELSHGPWWHISLLCHLPMHSLPWGHHARLSEEAYLSTHQLTADSKAMEFAVLLCLNFKDVPGVSSSFYYFLGNVFKPRETSSTGQRPCEMRNKDKNTPWFFFNLQPEGCSQSTSLSLWRERQSLEFRPEEGGADRGGSSRERQSGPGGLGPGETAEEALCGDLTVHKVHHLRTGDNEPQAKPYWSQITKFESLEGLKPLPSRVAILRNNI